MLVCIKLFLIQNNLVDVSLTQRHPRGTFLAALVGPLGWSPPKCKKQCRRLNSISVQNFSQICLAVLEEMPPKQTDRQTANLISPH